MRPPWLIALACLLAPAVAPAEEPDPCSGVAAALAPGCRTIVEAVRCDDVGAIVAMLPPDRPLVWIDRRAAPGARSVRFRDVASLRAAVGPSLRTALHLGPVGDDRIRVVHHVRRRGDCVPTFLRVEVRNGGSFASLALADGAHLSLVITRPR